MNDEKKNQRFTEKNIIHLERQNIYIFSVKSMLLKIWLIN